MKAREKFLMDWNRLIIRSLCQPNIFVGSILLNGQGCPDEKREREKETPKRRVSQNA